MNGNLEEDDEVVKNIEWSLKQMEVRVVQSVCVNVVDWWNVSVDAAALHNNNGRSCGALAAGQRGPITLQPLHQGLRPYFPLTQRRQSFQSFSRTPLWLRPKHQSSFEKVFLFSLRVHVRRAPQC